MIEALFVALKYMRRGVGSLLVERVTPPKGSLLTEVNEQNEAAPAFYLRPGFTVTGRLPLDRQGRPYPLLTLSRPEIIQV